VATRTPHGTRLFHPADVEAYRRARITRLASQLRAAAEPRDGEPWNAEQSSALDLALDIERRLDDEADW
jgi:hypothetical protein